MRKHFNEYIRHDEYFHHATRYEPTPGQRLHGDSTP